MLEEPLSDFFAPEPESFDDDDEEDDESPDVDDESLLFEDDDESEVDGLVSLPEPERLSVR